MTQTRSYGRPIQFTTDGDQAPPWFAEYAKATEDRLRTLHDRLDALEAGPYGAEVSDDDEGSAHERKHGMDRRARTEDRPAVIKNLRDLNAAWRGRVV